MSEVSKQDYAYVLGVDPGTTTGLAVVRYNLANHGKPEAVWSDQLPWDEAAGKLEVSLENLRRILDAGGAKSVACACEKFTINAQTAQRGQSGAEDALGMIGVARRNCYLTGVEFIKPEQASAAKKLVNDAMLKRLKLYSPMMVHSNDAARHAVLYAIKRRLFNLRWLVDSGPLPEIG